MARRREGMDPAGAGVGLAELDRGGRHQRQLLARPPPPRHSGTRTASSPTWPSTGPRRGPPARRPRCCLPRSPSWRPWSGTTSSGTRRTRVMPPVGRRRTGGPPFELPADPVGDGRRGEARLVAPDALMALAVLGLDRDQHLRADQPVGRQGGVEPVGQRLATNATGSTLVTAGSNSVWTASSGGGRRVDGGRSSPPEASRWASRPSGPNRSRTWRAGRAADRAEGAQAEA